MKSFVNLVGITLLALLASCSALSMTAPPENVLLKSLSVEGLTLTPAFDPAISEYTASTTFAWTAKIQAETLAKSVTLAGTGEQNLTGRVTDLVVAGTGAAGAVSKYHVKVTLTDVKEGEKLSTFLKTLTVTNGTLVPAFSPEVTDYRLVLSGLIGASEQIDVSTNGVVDVQGDGVTYANAGATLHVVVKVSGSSRSYNLAVVRGSRVDYQTSRSFINWVAPTSQAAQSGDSVTIAADASTAPLTGHTFAGWNTASDGSGTSYQPGDTLKLGDSGLTLYAQWTTNQYAVIYDANGATGGTVPVESILHDYQSNVTVLGNAGFLVKTGFNFAGWNTVADGTGTSYSASSTFAQGEAAVRLFARWTRTVAAVLSGTAKTMIVDTSGDLWAMGDNSSGELGDGTAIAKSQPVKVLSTVSAVAGRWGATMIQKTDGTLWATGDNTRGQLADGTSISKSTPDQVMSGVASVASGPNHTLILKTDSTLWATGDNNYGQFGNGTTSNSHQLIPVQVASGVSAIAAGYDYSMILKNDGTLWASGTNFHGELGDGTSADKATPVLVMSAVSAVSTSSYLFGFTMILKTDGTLWATGYNSKGQLGDGTTVQKLSPVQVMSAVSSISAGDEYAMCVKTDGTLWATGSNNYGQLGNGTTVNRTTFVQVMTGVSAVSAGATHTAILKTDGTLWIAGSANYGTTRHSTPVQIIF